MNKKNVIIISVLVNAGLLLVLFISALTSKEEVVQTAAKEPQFSGSEQVIGQVQPSVSMAQELPLAQGNNVLATSVPVTENKASESNAPESAQVALPQVALSGASKMVDEGTHLFRKLKRAMSHLQLLIWWR
jgi:hypothetical protein